MKKFALMALLLSVFTLQSTITANAAAFPSARLAAINRIAANNAKYLKTTTSTTNNSTRQGKVDGWITVRSSLKFFNSNGGSLKNQIATIYPGTTVTVLDGGKKYFSSQGNMYMYHIKFTTRDGITKTGYAPAIYIQLI